MTDLDKNKHSTYKTELCNDSMLFSECELAILRDAVDEAEEMNTKELVQNESTKKIIKIVEQFIIEKNLICYGGTAINNILPKDVQFYNHNVEIPDYDFYSPTAIEHAKELADLFYSLGYTEVEAKAGVHYGTYKVYVSFIPIADITYLVPQIFDAILDESIIIDGIHYAPANFLRMNIYIELSRPSGDISRWEKVFKRLKLLNQYYPIQTSNCKAIDFQQDKHRLTTTDSEDIYNLVRDSFIEQGVIFFGGYAMSVYSQYIPLKKRNSIKKTPDFDVIAKDIDKCVLNIIQKLNKKGFKNVSYNKIPAMGEVIPEYIDLQINGESLAYIFKSEHCYSYNEVTIDMKIIRIATIETILSFYMGFLYSKSLNKHKERLLCMMKFLFELQNANKLEQTGLLKRFSLTCYGQEKKINDIRIEKLRKYDELKDRKNSYEYDLWFLKYNPKEDGFQKKTHGKIEKKNDMLKKQKTKKVKRRKDKSKKNKTRTYMNFNRFFFNKKRN